MLCKWAFVRDSRNVWGSQSTIDFSGICHWAAFKVTAHLHAGNLAVEHVPAETHSGPVECMWHFIVLKCCVILMSHFLRKDT